jgi:4-hydroxymandelate oxidase
LVEDVRLPVSVQDYEDRAKDLLSKQAYDYYAGGAEEEWTLRENRAAFGGFVLRPRVLVDVSKRHTSSSVLGQPVSVPVLVAPTALHRLADPEGEVATARAAAACGTVMVLSTLGTASIEEVAGAGPGTRWFQLYVLQDRVLTEELIHRARDAGYGALVLTVDLPVLGSRDRDQRNQFSVPEDVTYANLAAEQSVNVAGSDLAAFVEFEHSETLTWDDLDWIRSAWRGPFVLKGILTAEDARLAADAGVDAVVVSNHGGRQLDGSVPSVEALPEVVEAVGDETEIYLDGGVRRGSDVLKALALGARAVLVGRPVLWGLAVGGEAGVRHVLEILRGELDIAMAIAGCRSVMDITPELVARR